MKLQHVANFLFLKGTIWKMLFLFAISLMLRVSLFDTESGDYRVFLSRWYDYIVENGGYAALKNKFHNYQMPYLYLLATATYLPIKKLYAIKLISVLFDYIAAIFVYKIVKIKYGNNSYLPLLSMFIFLFTPTIFLNSSGWGQCDAIYSSFLLISGYYCLKEQYNKVFIFFSIAFTFKMQAIFFAPILLILCYKKKTNVLNFLYLPFIYFISILPARLIGRSWEDLLSIHLRQSSNYHELSMNAPNIYAWISNDYYHVVTIAGIIFSIALLVFACCYICKKITIETPSRWIEIILFFLILVPYFTPKMHDRFFYPADVFSVIYFFYFPQRFYIPLMMLTASIFVYPPVIHTVNLFIQSSQCVAILPFLGLIGIAYHVMKEENSLSYHINI